MNKFFFNAGLLLMFVSGTAGAGAGAGDFAISLGMVNINNSRSYSTPQHTELSSSIATRTGLVPQSFDSPGTKQTVNDANKPILTLSYFMTDHWAITAVVGIPPTHQLHGHGAVKIPGPLTNIIPTVNMGQQANNPNAHAMFWFPVAMVQYYIGDRSNTFRPNVGIGLGYAFFTHVRLHQNFQKHLNSVASMLAFASTLDFTDSSSAEATGGFVPVYSGGLSYELNKQLALNLAISYAPISAKSTIFVRDKFGNKILTSTANLTIPTVATSVNVGYTF